MIILAQGKKKLDHFELILTPKTIIKNWKKKKITYKFLLMTRIQPKKMTCNFDS